MGGGLMQLVAYGAQDIYLTGNPQITFFKVVYRRHTNFSMESIKQTFSGTPDYGGNSTCTISRNGDLIYRIWLEHVPHINKPKLNIPKWITTDTGPDSGDTENISPTIHGFVPNYGHALIKEVELEIGGQTIDKQTGQWMQSWSDLTNFNPETLGFAERLNLAESSSANIYNDFSSSLTESNGLSGYPISSDKSNPYVGNLDTKSKTLFQKMTGISNESGISCKSLDPSGLGGDENSNVGLLRGNANQLYFGINGGAKVLDYACNSGDDTAKSERIFIPLQFWFCRNIGLALPLIALQYHEVKIKLTLSELDKLYGYSGCFKRADTGGAENAEPAAPNYGCTGATVSPPTKGNNTQFDLWVDYIYLDTDERRRFAQVSHEYLIEQVQYKEEPITITNGNDQNFDIDLKFNHPIKEMIWFARNTQSYLFGNLPAIITDSTHQATHSSEQVYPLLVNADGDDLASGSDTISTVSQGDGHEDGGDLTHAGHIIFKNVNSIARQHGSATFLSDLSDRNDASWQLMLNGHDRFAKRTTKYFTRTQVRDYHTGQGGIYNKDSISIYSFALKPEEHQPSGTCNFSRIDKAQLKGENIKYPRGANELSIYAVNYNVLRIMSGMGGLAYSN